MARVRLYLDHPLGAGQTIPLPRDQAHYLTGVMRLAPGDTVAVFNGRDGEWGAEITTAGKRAATLTVGAQTAPQRDPPDLWLIFAPIKKARTDFIVEKAAEMGAARILPVQTEFTNSERIRRDRLQAHAVEAAEQCGGTYVPEVAELAPLSSLLDQWPADRALIFCDEALAGTPVPSSWSKYSGGLPGTGSGGSAPSAAILIGPEGGFLPAERDRLSTMGSTHAISLGPRILRADTAAVAALTLWQATAGDWSP